jgi:hypothetical protein
MEQSTPPQRGRLFGWVSRKPKHAFWITLVVALLVGIAIGAGGASGQAEADKAKSDAARAQHQLGGVRAELGAVRSQRDKLADQLSSSNSRAQTAQAAVKKLSAKAEVPDLTGQDASGARSNELVDQLGWKLRTVRRTTTATDPGTVISQSPREGKVLRAGRSITLVVARKPPPKPKQWVTVKTLQGASSTKTEEFHVPSGVKARLQYSMPEDSNNAIILYKAPKEYVDLVLNEIGPQQGSTRLYEPGTFYLDVTGSYTIQVQVFKRPS